MHHGHETLRGHTRATLGPYFALLREIRLQPSQLADENMFAYLRAPTKLFNFTRRELLWRFSCVFWSESKPLEKHDFSSSCSKPNKLTRVGKLYTTQELYTGLFEAIRGNRARINYLIEKFWATRGYLRKPCPNESFNWKILGYSRLLEKSVPE